jgi:hypothetical protein
MARAERSPLEGVHCYDSVDVPRGTVADVVVSYWVVRDVFMDSHNIGSMALPLTKVWVMALPDPLGENKLTCVLDSRGGANLRKFGLYECDRQERKVLTRDFIAKHKAKLRQLLAEDSQKPDGADIALFDITDIRFLIPQQ